MPLTGLQVLERAERTDGAGPSIALCEAHPGTEPRYVVVAWNLDAGQTEAVYHAALDTARVDFAERCALYHLAAG